MIDVLIIGSGGAGLTAALEIKNSCDNVVVLSKTYPTASQTCQAQGGINAVLNDSIDTEQNHILDTLKSAHNLGDEETIKYMCQNSSKTIKWLDDIGVPFSRDEKNNIAQRTLGGASNPRACYSSDYTGLKILHTLYDTCLKNGINFINEHMLLNFIVIDEVVKGITALNIETSEVIQILAKKVIIASGGYSGIYNQYTTNSTATTGEVISAALRAGCKLENMEYVQFHPTSLKDSCILISESARGEGGYLVDSNGERFVDELKPRDIVARAIYNKIESGKDVFLDLRHLGKEKILKTMPQEYDLCVNFINLKLDEDLIPIKPAAHYTMGGIKVDINGKTNIKNLYAIGECSSNGVHGANRLGGNSLLEIITFGKLVASNVLIDINGIEEDLTNEYDILLKDKDFISSIFKKENKLNLYIEKESLGKLFYKKVGLFRDEDGLNIVLDEIDKLNEKICEIGIDDKSKIYNTNLKEYIELVNIIELSKIIVLSALDRKESRGAHYRIDYKDENKLYSKSTIIQKINENIIIEVQNG